MPGEYQLVLKYNRYQLNYVNSYYVNLTMSTVIMSTLYKMRHTFSHEYRILSIIGKLYEHCSIVLYIGKIKS